MTNEWRWHRIHQNIIYDLWMKWPTIYHSVLMLSQLKYFHEKSLFVHLYVNSVDSIMLWFKVHLNRRYKSLAKQLCLTTKPRKIPRASSTRPNSATHDHTSSQLNQNCLYTLTLWGCQAYIYARSLGTCIIPYRLIGDNICHDVQNFLCRAYVM